jgi:hypothetical protein
MSPSGVSSDALGEEQVRGWEKFARDNQGDARETTLGGHLAVLWWDQEAPPQPGCSSCAGDPGPDFVTVALSVYLGDTTNFGGRAVLDVRGRARVNADPADLFCDMESMLLGITLAR